MGKHFNNNPVSMVILHRVLTKNMKYEETAVKNSKGITKKVILKSMDSLSTGAIVWFIVKRHKLALIATWAVIITVIQLFPFVPSLIATVIGG